MDRIPESVQVSKALSTLKRLGSNLDKYMFLDRLYVSNRTLYFRILLTNIEAMMPIVYTPTVGLTCQLWSELHWAPKGLYITMEHCGQVEAVLREWHSDEIDAIVFTDGGRILGLGDLGANGMGIPVGKLALYVACAGIRPERCLPITIDVGTNNEKLLADPFYIGVRRHRQTGQRYLELVRELLDAAVKTFGVHCLLQFEDFGTENAIQLLQMHRNDYLVFNDDIQGTAAMVLSGVFASMRKNKTKISEQTFLFFGGGSAGIGIAHMIAQAISAETGGTVEASREQVFVVDSKGLVVTERSAKDLAEHKIPFAKSRPALFGSLDKVVLELRPSVLIGVSSQFGSFTKQVLRAMDAVNPDQCPIIFALSNPTSKAECTAEDAYVHTRFRAIYASGSPFDPVPVPEGLGTGARVYTPGQGNNAFVFPGLALGSIFCKSTRVSDLMLLSCSKRLSELVSDDLLEQHCVFPLIRDIRDVSLELALAVVKVAVTQGLAKCENTIALVKSGNDQLLKRRIMTSMYTGDYSKL